MKQLAFPHCSTGSFEHVMSSFPLSMSGANDGKPRAISSGRLGASAKAITWNNYHSSRRVGMGVGVRVGDEVSFSGGHFVEPNLVPRALLDLVVRRKKARGTKFCWTIKPWTHRCKGTAWQLPSPFFPPFLPRSLPPIPHHNTCMPTQYPYHIRCWFFTTIISQIKSI